MSTLGHLAHQTCPLVRGLTVAQGQGRPASALPFGHRQPPPAAAFPETVARAGGAGRNPRARAPRGRSEARPRTPARRPAPHLSPLAVRPHRPAPGRAPQHRPTLAGRRLRPPHRHHRPHPEQHGHRPQRRPDLGIVRGLDAGKLGQAPPIALTQAEPR